MSLILCHMQVILVGLLAQACLSVCGDTCLGERVNEIYDRV